MRRREFIGLVSGAAAAWPSAAFTQVLPKRPVVAILLGGSPGYATFVAGFEKGMKELGYVEGRDFDIVYRYANGDLTRVPMLVNELMPDKPAVFVTGLSSGMFAIKRANASVPIVSTSITDDKLGYGM